jgi:tetratricopeptide (TPR) repeat protein
MRPSLVFVFVGFLYVLLFSCLALIRREGISVRFILEASILTGLVAGLAAVTEVEANPILFLLVIYLFTMRVRLLVDFGNLMARRRHYRAASRIYRLGLRFWPDDANRVAVQINQGVLSLQTGQLDEAIEMLRGTLDFGNKVSLSLKQQSGCHYNLGVAYERKGMDVQADAQFKTVLDLWPGSEFASHAAAALERRQRKKAVQNRLEMPLVIHDA